MNKVVVRPLVTGISFHLIRKNLELDKNVDSFLDSPRISYLAQSKNGLVI